MREIKFCVSMSKHTQKMQRTSHFRLILLFRLKPTIPHKGPILDYAKIHFKETSQNVYSFESIEGDTAIVMVDPSKTDIQRMIKSHVNFNINKVPRFVSIIISGHGSNSKNLIEFWTSGDEHFNVLDFVSWMNVPKSNSPIYFTLNIFADVCRSIDAAQSTVTNCAVDETDKVDVDNLGCRILFVTAVHRSTCALAIPQFGNGGYLDWPAFITLQTQNLKNPIDNWNLATQIVQKAVRRVFQYHCEIKKSCFLDTNDIDRSLTIPNTINERVWKAARRSHLLSKYSKWQTRMKSFHDQIEKLCHSMCQMYMNFPMQNRISNLLSEQGRKEEIEVFLKENTCMDMQTLSLKNALLKSSTEKMSVTMLGSIR